jgi:hypothetical protein
MRTNPFYDAWLFPQSSCRASSCSNAGRSLGLDGLLARAPFAPFVGEGLIGRAYRKIA